MMKETAENLRYAVIQQNQALLQCSCEVAHHGCSQPWSMQPLASLGKCQQGGTSRRCVSRWEFRGKTAFGPCRSLQCPEQFRVAACNGVSAPLWRGAQLHNCRTPKAMLNEADVPPDVWLLRVGIQIPVFRVCSTSTVWRLVLAMELCWLWLDSQL